MPRRSQYEEDFDYDDEEFEDNHKGPRRFKKEQDNSSKKKKWERESAYDRDHDYDERR
jgi:hypothetical protein